MVKVLSGRAASLAGAAIVVGAGVAAHAQSRNIYQGNTSLVLPYVDRSRRDGVVIGLSANTAIAEATSIYLRYEGDVPAQDSAHAITAGVRITW